MQLARIYPSVSGIKLRGNEGTLFHLLPIIQKIAEEQCFVENRMEFASNWNAGYMQHLPVHFFVQSKE